MAKRGEYWRLVESQYAMISGGDETPSLARLL